MSRNDGLDVQRRNLRETPEGVAEMQDTPLTAAGGRAIVWGGREACHKWTVSEARIAGRKVPLTE